MLQSPSAAPFRAFPVRQTCPRCRGAAYRAAADRLGLPAGRMQRRRRQARPGRAAIQGHGPARRQQADGRPNPPAQVKLGRYVATGSRGIPRRVKGWFDWPGRPRRGLVHGRRKGPRRNRRRPAAEAVRQGRPQQEMAMAQTVGERNSGTPDESHRGVEPLHCGCRHFRLVCTRSAWGGQIIRRREYRHSGKRVSTWERPL